jgi:DNA-binding transcriptional regulator YhcF (GntR family)
MAFYKGKTADGSDMQEVQGMYISECGNYWSNRPYPITRELNRHLRFANITLKESYQAILNAKSIASKRVQKYLIANYKALNPEDK